MIMAKDLQLGQGSDQGPDERGQIEQRGAGRTVVTGDHLALQQGAAVCGRRREVLGGHRCRGVAGPGGIDGDATRRRAQGCEVARFGLDDDRRRTAGHELLNTDRPPGLSGDDDHLGRVQIGCGGEGDRQGGQHRCGHRLRTLGGGDLEGAHAGTPIGSERRTVSAAASASWIANRRSSINGSVAGAGRSPRAISASCRHSAS